MPTEFGPVTLCFQVQQGGKRLDVSFRATFRHQPDKILLHVPPLPDLQEVAVGERVFKAQPGEVLEIQSEP